MARVRPYRALSACVAGAALVLCLCGTARATDLGVQGHIWPIIEIDIRQLLAEQVAQVNWKKVQNGIAHSAHAYLNNLPQEPVHTVSQTETSWIDPSFVLNQDIRAPAEDARGNWKWTVLYKKGMKFDPLSVERPFNALFFFDGRDPTQVAFAAKIAKAFPSKVMLVEASGANPEHMAERWHMPVFTETNGMRERFPISVVPSLLYPGNGAHRLLLGLTAFAAPYSVGQLSRAWPEVKTDPYGKAQQ